jgi:hypothetical protein
VYTWVICFEKWSYEVLEEKNRVREGKRWVFRGGEERKREEKWKNEVFFRVGGYLYPGPIPCAPVHGIMMQPRAINHPMLIRRSWFLSFVIRPEPSDLSDGQDLALFFCLLVHTQWASWTGPNPVFAIHTSHILLFTPPAIFIFLFLFYLCVLLYLNVI